MISDARLLELDFLSYLSRNGVVEVCNDGTNIPRRDMIVHLLMEELVNDIAGSEPNADRSAWYEAELIFESLKYDRNQNLIFFLTGRKISMRISHKGRIRLAELEHAIKTGREREPFGILYGARYWERDLRIALLSASQDAPVALCFLDMNGLKSINDTHGHEAGNDAIRTFLRVIAANVEEVGDAYRYGGDEVVVILQCTDADKAGALMAALLKELGEEKIESLEYLQPPAGLGSLANLT